eukprot:g10843.t1
MKSGFYFITAYGHRTRVQDSDSDSDAQVVADLSEYSKASFPSQKLFLKIKVFYKYCAKFVPQTRSVNHVIHRHDSPTSPDDSPKYTLLKVYFFNS